MLLWLFVMNLGVAVGAGLYEHRIVVPDWLASAGSEVHWNAEAAQRHDTGRRFWVFVTTLPLTLLTFANLFAAWRAVAPVRRWWIRAALVALLDRIVTFAYFIPTMVALMQAPDSPQSVELATEWSVLNYLRHAVVLSAWVCSLAAFWFLAQHSLPRDKSPV